MSNNKQSRIYQCVELLSKGVNNLDIRTTIINAYEKEIMLLKEHIEKLILDLQDKKKIISNLEEEIKHNKTTTFVGYLYSDEVLKNGIDLMKIAQGYTDTIHQLTLENLKVLEENETLKETNKHLKEENKKLKQNFSALEISYAAWKSVAIKTETENESLKRLMKTYPQL